jgi:DNA/RNA endonuclease YhcR with UshA esterase domain
LITAAAETTPLTPAEAAKKVNEKVVMQMEVKSTGGDNNRYLNSEEDFKDPRNFTIFIAKNDLEKFQKAGVEKPEVHFKGKLIEVTGTVVLQKEKPQIKVSEPEQIKIVVKEKT